MWFLPNALITPHVAGNSPEATVRAFELAGDQIRRFAAGQPLRNQVPRYALASAGLTLGLESGAEERARTGRYGGSR